MAIMVVGDSTVKLVAGVDPNRTDVTPKKFVPVIVTELPPLAEPEDGTTCVTVGPESFVEAWTIQSLPSYRNHTAVALPYSSTTIWATAASWPVWDRSSGVACQLPPKGFVEDWVIKLLPLYLTHTAVALPLVSIAI